MRDQCRSSLKESKEKEKEKTFPLVVGWLVMCMFAHMNNSTLYTLGSIKQLTNTQTHTRKKEESERGLSLHATTPCTHKN